jgi:sugar-specific transcriptional regulator TrmB
MDYRELVNLGLSEKEAKVYLAALELGKAPVAKIAQKAEVNRATTYVQIKSLMAKGLMSSYEEGKKTYYFAEFPEKLSLLFREQAMAIQRKQEYLDKILPELRSLNTLEKDKPTVRYFTGKNGIYTMVEEFLQMKSKIARLIYSVDALNKIFSDEERKKARVRRIKKGIKTKVIYTYKDGELKSTRDGERRKIPFEKFPITCDIALFDNKVRIASLGKRLVGIIIEDDEIAKSLKSVFELAWLGAEKFKKKKKARDKK